ncbi:hypothetical protein RB981_002705 [Vibrio cholerae]|uniref:hypothetical protein n=1 Tax=Vibrio cholerae TaxID=666 RepID=UPI0011D88C57|nr:hypothetical protein [Vibrio cholerae]ELE7141937.1 hypothetical protein [Vibrio cholerae]MCR9707112.1 hypothetical protein [Vibrio cholerae]MCR9871743.1 hypothetical protein [Vibrio cholerae]TXZ95914.1 hypothetical protein FXE30_00625 [Vibrio cholerae]GHX72480.1 hypothetical protein VCSRO16_3455 [Vibrio cholerae]
MNEVTKLELLQSDPNSSYIHVVNDFANDYGLPKGTALLRDTVYPFCMGNEAYDGFIVIEIDRIPDSDLVDRFNYIAPMLLKSRFREVCNHMQLAELIVTSKPSMTSKLALCANDYDIDLSEKFNSLLVRRIAEQLGTLRSESESKFIELCGSSCGRSFVVVHAGCSDLQNMYFYMLKQYGVAAGHYDMSGFSKTDISYVFHTLAQSLPITTRILRLLDCLRQFAAINRELIAVSIARELVLDDDGLSIVFHDEHAAISKCADGRYLHQNSIHHHTPQKGKVGFIAGPPNFIIEFENVLEEFFYPHKLTTNRLESSLPTLVARNVANAIELRPLANTKW